MIIVQGMFKGHVLAGGYPYGGSDLIESGVVVCPDWCIDEQHALHASYDGVVLRPPFLQVKDADEGRVIKQAWPKEFWERWQLGEDRLFHLREELPA